MKTEYEVKVLALQEQSSRARPPYSLEATTARDAATGARRALSSGRAVALWSNGPPSGCSLVDHGAPLVYCASHQQSTSVSIDGRVGKGGCIGSYDNSDGCSRQSRCRVRAQPPSRAAGAPLRTPPPRCRAGAPTGAAAIQTAARRRACWRRRRGRGDVAPRVPGGPW